MTIDDLVLGMKKGEKVIIGMVHCLPLPGTLNFCGDMSVVYEKALKDAITLQEAKVDAIIVENTLDMPFTDKLEIEQLAALSAITKVVVDNVSLPVGVGASFNDGLAGIAIAKATGAQFIRSAVFVDTRVATGLGVMYPVAKDLSRYKKQIAAENIRIFADIQVKHSHPLVENIAIEESAQSAQEAGADVLIVTGYSTGYQTPIEKIKKVRESASIPLIIGSGFSSENAFDQLDISDGAIVGSAIKKYKDIEGPIDLDLCKDLMKEVDKRRRLL